MSNLNQLMETVSALYNEDISPWDVSEAVHVLETPVSELALREYLNFKSIKDDYMQYDAMEDTYKRKSEDVYEQLRQRTLILIENENNVLKQVKLLMETSKEIREGIKGIYYNNTFRDCCKIPFMINVCKNMILAGASLTEIVKYVPESQMGDIYHLAEDYLGLHLALTEEEKAEVERYDKEDGENKVRRTNVWQQLFVKGIPHKKDGVWTMDDDPSTYDTYGMACRYAGCELSYPYYKEDVKNPRYADTFEEILEKTMLFPQDISIEGLERAYSPQEYHLVISLREKLLERIAQGK